MPLVSIIISNRNDLAMLSVTIRSCIEELKPLGPGQGEIVICDNSDEEVYSRLNSIIPAGYVKDGTIKVLRQDFPCLFSARETAAKAASSPYILCLDSHMIVGRDMILDLVSFMQRQGNGIGFAHAPISWSHQHESRARHDRNMSEHELGPWGTVYSSERTITWKGMPWICRKDWFLNELNGYGALSEHHLSWGGGDLHIGIKPWLLGYKNWAVPTSPGIHIGPFPKVDLGKDPVSPKVPSVNADERYRRYAKSGVGPHTIGFLVSCYVLGGEAMMNRNAPMLKQRFGKYMDADKWWDRAKEFGKNEKKWLDANKIMTFEQLLKRKPWDAN